MLFVSSGIYGQNDRFNRVQNRIAGFGRNFKSGSGTDSLRHRNPADDSITVTFHYLDTTKSAKPDTTVNDYARIFPVPADFIYLGNLGNAARSLLFSPALRAGFDPGFHAFDLYKWKPEQIRFYQTTRPYSEIHYFLGTRTEQVIELLHTQNIKPNWNAAFDYRLINSPGIFKNQKTNHNNYLLNSAFQSKNLRYHNYFIFLDNKLQASENGGIASDTYLNDPDYNNRFSIPTQLGGDASFSTNFFSNRITTGHKYNEFIVYLRQQYDLGKKDSLVSDSTVIPLFYPRVRFEHTISYAKLKYEFLDESYINSVSGSIYKPDSNYYKNNYGFRPASDTLFYADKWKVIENDFSLYQFPDAKNLQQFIKLGLSIQNLTGQFTAGGKTYFNSFGHAEYRNKTRNKQWDLEAAGKLFFTGYNAGDFDAQISLQKSLGKRSGYLQLAFANTSRTPSFIYNTSSSYYLLQAAASFKKENNTRLHAGLFLPGINLQLSGSYYLLTNYTYITSYYQLMQQGALFNVLQLSAEKTFVYHKHLNWHAEFYFQQTIGNAPVHLPAIFTRHRIAYEGKLGFRNLLIAMGAEMKYFSNYKADAYSPLLGQFYFQDGYSVKEHLPDISLYINFRIRNFKAFIRAENLNTAHYAAKKFGFTNNNLVAPGYPMPGLVIHTGVVWSFVN